MHTFQYGRKEQKILDDLCYSVNYYKRNTSFLNIFSKIPYIVKSRKNETLLNNLLQDNYPILFEGLHTCFYLNSDLLKNRIKLFRAHNIEHEYYNELANNESNLFKRIFFKQEASKLKKFEKSIAHANSILSISKNDFTYFKKHSTKSEYIPAFHPYNEMKCIEGKGKYILFHGNLSVAENITSANYLIKNVFSKIDYPVIIAGKNPRKSIIAKTKNIEIVSNPDENEMQNLIQNAHIIILHSFQNTGIKLKLLSSLYAGRFCIANSTIIENTDLESICSINDSPENIITEIGNLFERDFTTDEINNRKNILYKHFSNTENANKILKILHNE